MTGNVTYGDNVKANFGTSEDLQIYHDGSNSYITDVGTGNLIITGNLTGNVTGNVTGTVSDISNHSTSDLSEGTNLYYTDARFDTRLATKDTDDVSEGTSNLYYTDARVQNVSINNVVEDTTPQLGGTLDLNSNNILITTKLSLEQVQIYRYSIMVLSSYVQDQGTGNLRFLLKTFKRRKISSMRQITETYASLLFQTITECSALLQQRSKTSHHRYR
jgi:hypothetical protein